MSNMATTIEMEVRILQKRFSDPEDRLRLSKLGPQPNPWVIGGLSALEEGRQLKPQDLTEAERLQTTTHPSLKKA